MSDTPRYDVRMGNYGCYFYDTKMNMDVMIPENLVLLNQYDEIYEKMLRLARELNESKAVNASVSVDLDAMTLAANVLKAELNESKKNRCTNYAESACPNVEELATYSCTNGYPTLHHNGKCSCGHCGSLNDCTLTTAARSLVEAVDELKVCEWKTESMKYLFDLLQIKSAAVRAAIEGGK